MTWHLKDRELEKKLIERFPSFVYELGKHCESSGNFNFSVKLCRKGFCYYTDEMTFSKDELEEVPEYNPKIWNEFPKVKPPYNVMMRVETYTGQGYKLFYAHFKDGDSWSDPNHLLMSEAFSDGVTRFRPWED